jgi:hypothetical protein
VFLLIILKNFSFKGDCMKKLFTFAITMLLGASLAVAQATSGGTGTSGSTESNTPATTTKAKKHHHHSGKKHKKAAAASASTPSK